MLQYRRRNSNTAMPSRMHTQSHPLVTYCNWSYDRNNHIDTETLINLLSHFDKRYTHIYLRIINETPRSVVDSFIEIENLDSSVLRTIHHILRQRGFDLLILLKLR